MHLQYQFWATGWSNCDFTMWIYTWISSFTRLKWAGMLRTPEAAEIAGLDTTKVPAQAFPEGIPASAQPAE